MQWPYPVEGVLRDEDHALLLQVVHDQVAHRGLARRQGRHRTSCFGQMTSVPVHCPLVTV